MKILAIRLARFGDIALLLPALTQLKAAMPGSHLTFLTDQRLAPLAGLCPAIDDIIAVDRIAMRDGARWASMRSIRQVVREVRRRRFDLAVDFHGFRETNLLTWLSRAPRRLGLKRDGQSFLNFCFNLPAVPEDKTIHAGAMFMRVVERFGKAHAAMPALVIPPESHKWLAGLQLRRPFAALYVDAPTTKRIWPAENFAALADHLAGHEGLDVLALAGADGAAQLDRLRGNMKFPGQLQTFSNLTIPQLAAVVEAAQLLVSNDTGPMHLGPLLGVPTLGLFSIGLPEHFRPTGEHDGFLLGNPIDRIAVSDAVARVVAMRAMGRRDLRH